MSTDDSEYSPIEAMKAIARRLHHLVPDDLHVSMDVSYPYEMTFHHKGKLARAIMLGDNLAIANGESGTPTPLALDEKITEYNLTAAVERLQGFLTEGC